MKRKLLLSFSLLFFLLVNVLSAQLIDNGNGTITDTKTGLMWLKTMNQSGQLKSWDDAMDWGAKLDFAGYQDWRLPSGKDNAGIIPNSNHPYGWADIRQTELWSLYGTYGIRSGYLYQENPLPFELGLPANSMVPQNYWTSTEWIDPWNPPDPNSPLPEAMALDFSEGGANEWSKSQTFGAWAVRDTGAVPPPVPIDVWIKDCPEDMGAVPSVPNPCSACYLSPDIFIDNDDDGYIDAPVYGINNVVKAIVRNNSAAWVLPVTVTFFYLDSSTGLGYPEGAQIIPGAHPTYVTLPPNGSAVAETIWQIPQPPPGQHYCIVVKVEHSDDMPTSSDIALSNNLASVNDWVIAERAGQPVDLSFDTGSGGANGFGLSPWPRTFVLKAIDKLPKDWSWSIIGAEIDKPFGLKLGEKRQVRLSIKVPKNTPVRASGTLEIYQQDIRTGKSVGGLIYRVYEDHFPPKRIDKLEIELVDGRPTLSWDRVQKEDKTDLPEKASYYHIFRNGKLIDKVAIDNNPHKMGFQWTDRGQATGAFEYSVRAVDEAGNTSDNSPVARIDTLGTKSRPFTWITWLLVLIIAVLIGVIVAKRTRT